MIGNKPLIRHVAHIDASTAKWLKTWRKRSRSRGDVISKLCRFAVQNGFNPNNVPEWTQPVK